MKVINKHHRSKLCEGRSQGLGFTFLKKINPTTFETVYPISPCKDYLNDVVYAEETGKPCIAFGCHAKKEGIFEDGVYLVMKICGNRDGSSYPNFEKDKQEFNSNILNVLKFLNTFEKLFKFKSLSKLISVDEYEDVDKHGGTVHIVKLNKKWKAGTYLISLCTLLIRIAQWYDGKQDVFEYIKSLGNKTTDSYIINPVLTKVKKYIEEGLPVQDLSQAGSGTTVHNLGILTYAGK